jgi:hypothetical protein
LQGCEGCYVLCDVAVSDVTATKVQAGEVMKGGEVAQQG